MGATALKRKIFRNDKMPLAVKLSHLDIERFLRAAKWTERKWGLGVGWQYFWQSPWYFAMQKVSKERSQPELEMKVGQNSGDRGSD